MKINWTHSGGKHHQGCDSSSFSVIWNILHDPLLCWFLENVRASYFSYNFNWKKVIVMDCPESKAFGCKLMSCYTWIHSLENNRNILVHSFLLISNGMDFFGLALTIYILNYIFSPKQTQHLLLCVHAYGCVSHSQTYRFGLMRLWPNFP